MKQKQIKKEEGNKGRRLNHARHYSQEDMCIIGKEEKEDYHLVALRQKYATLAYYSQSFV